jgi:uncharacterized protein (DUF1684 family)
MMTELIDSRNEKDAFFKNDPQSPLDSSQKATFTGLHYFPENQAVRLNVNMETYPEPKQITMATSTGDEQEYLHVGQISFVLKGQHAVLQVYLPMEGGNFFIPFVDATAPKETYGAGRYLEAFELADGRLHVDFNLAYNPYCAYNDNWSCPLPPEQNRLSMRIEAGEMKFHE